MLALTQHARSPACTGALSAQHDPVGDVEDLVGGGVEDDQRELVAAEPGHGVGLRGPPASSLRATSTSSWSPTACPKLSLTALNPSRSSTSTAGGDSARSARAIAWAMRSASRVRLARSVSGS